MDMEALFAEMRKAQTGGKDFVAEQRAREAAVASDDEDEASDERDEDDNGEDEEDGHLPARGLTRSEEARLLRVSQAGRSSARAGYSRGGGSGGGGGGGGGGDFDDESRPQPSVEAARHRAIAALASKFEAACGHALGGRWWSHYENWLYSRRSAAAGAAAAKASKRAGGDAAASAPTLDPVIPDPDRAGHDPELLRKLIASGLSQYEAKGACANLARATAKAAAQAAHEGASGGGGGNKPVKLTTFEVGAKGSGDYEGGAGGALKAQLTCGKVKMEINATHLDKLRALHQIYDKGRNGGGGGRGGGGGGGRGDAAAERRFRDAAFCLLARYSAMQGAHYKAGAMQAAIPSTCFDALREQFDVSMELCASPFNCHFRRYCSAFVDTDGPFGSLGDCFQFHPEEGSFEANPPFDPGLISRLVGHLEGLLSRSKKPLSFAVVVPHWPEKSAWQKLANSAYAKRAVKVEAGKHGFVAGGQHLRPDKVVPSAAATTLVFLQNDAGAERWPVTKDKLAAVRKGFRGGVGGEGGDINDDDHDADAVNSEDGDDVDDEDDDEDANVARKMEAAKKRRAAAVGTTMTTWDPDAVLFYGVGSGKRWGERPADWIIDAAGDVIEDHWVGEDTEEDEEDEEEEEDEELEEDVDDDDDDDDDGSSEESESEEEAFEDDESEEELHSDQEDSEESDDEESEEDELGAFEFDESDSVVSESESEEEEAPPVAMKRKKEGATTSFEGHARRDEGKHQQRQKKYKKLKKI